MRLIFTADTILHLIDNDLIVVTWLGLIILITHWFPQVLTLTTRQDENDGHFITLFPLDTLNYLTEMLVSFVIKASVPILIFVFFFSMTFIPLRKLFTTVRQIGLLLDDPRVYARRRRQRQRQQRRDNNDYDYDNNYTVTHADDDANDIPTYQRVMILVPFILRFGAILGLDVCVGVWIMYMAEMNDCNVLARQITNVLVEFTRNFVLVGALVVGCRMFFALLLLEATCAH